MQQKGRHTMRTFSWLIAGMVLLCCLGAVARSTSPRSAAILQGQEFLPAPPADHSLVYILDARNNLVALPFEKAETPLKIEQKAGSTKISYLELKGEHAATVLAPDQRIFLFTFERPGV